MFNVLLPLLLCIVKYCIFGNEIELLMSVISPLIYMLLTFTLFQSPPKI